MFNGLKKLFSTADVPAPAAPANGITRDDRRQIADWALAAGFTYAEPPLPANANANPRVVVEQGFALDGQVLGRPWHLECGAPARDFIRKREVRMRCDLGVPESVMVVVMSRLLHASLEKQAYALYTDSLQTAVDPKLSEEMRWLAMFPLASWHGAPATLFDCYAVLAGKRRDAQTWIAHPLASALVKATSVVPQQSPLLLSLMRGKCYLRMQYSPANLALLQCVVKVFLTACESALTHSFAPPPDGDEADDSGALRPPLNSA